MAESSVGHPGYRYPRDAARHPESGDCSSHGRCIRQRADHACLSQADKPNARCYQSSPNKDEQCSGCQYFVEPHSCKIVVGTISPNGWCQFWLKKSA